MSLFNRRLNSLGGRFDTSNFSMPQSQVSSHFKYSKQAFQFAGVCSVWFVWETKTDVKQQRNVKASNRYQRPVK